MGSRALPEKVKNLEMVSVDCPSVEDSSVFVLFWRGSSTQRKKHETQRAPLHSEQDEQKAV